MSGPGTVGGSPIVKQVTPIVAKTADLKPVVVAAADTQTRAVADSTTVVAADLRATGTTPPLDGPPPELANGAALAPDQSPLRAGTRGPRVESLQRIINLNGRDPALEVDGKFGPLTQAAVRDFQTNSGLKPDGIAGPNTLRAAQAVEAMAAASCTVDRAAAERHLAVAEEAIKGIPEAERGTLTERLNTARANLPTATTPAVAPPIKGTGGAPAVTTAAQDANQVALVAEEEARDGSDAIESMVNDPATFNALGAPALESMLSNLSDDGYKTEGEAEAAGKIMGRLMKLDPSPANFERLSSQYSSAFDRKGDTLVNQALSQFTDAELNQLPPATVTAMREKLSSGSTSEVDQANMDRLDAALRHQGHLSGPEFVGPLTQGQAAARDEAQVALIANADDQAPWMGGSDAIIQQVTSDPSTLGRLSPAGLEAAYTRLADDGVKSEREAEVAGQLLGRLAVADPSRYDELRGQYSSLFDRKADTLAQQSVGVMSDAELLSLAKSNPPVLRSMYEALDSGWTTGSEQGAMDRIVTAQRQARLGG